MSYHRATESAHERYSYLLRSGSHPAIADKNTPLIDVMGEAGRTASAASGRISRGECKWHAQPAASNSPNKAISRFPHNLSHSIYTPSASLPDTYHATITLFAFERKPDLWQSLFKILQSTGSLTYSQEVRHGRSPFHVPAQCKTVCMCNPVVNADNFSPSSHHQSQNVLVAT